MNKKPYLFSNPKEALQGYADSIMTGAINKMAAAADRAGAQVEVRVPNYIKITIDVSEAMTPYDLKPSFANSPKAKTTKYGGWYLIVPISRKVSSMSDYVLNQANNIEITNPNNNSGTGYIDMLYGLRGGSNIIRMFDQNQKTGGNLTRFSHSDGTSNFIAFRTVSDKSPEDSWWVGLNSISHGDNSDKLHNALSGILESSLRGES